MTTPHATFARTLRRLLPPPPIRLECFLGNDLAAQLHSAPARDLHRNAAESTHEWFVKLPTIRIAEVFERLPGLQLLWEPRVLGDVLKQRLPVLQWWRADQEDLHDRYWYVPGVYQLEPRALRILARTHELHVRRQPWSLPAEVRDCIEDAKRSAQHGNTQRDPFGKFHVTILPLPAPERPRRATTRMEVPA